MDNECRSIILFLHVIKMLKTPFINFTLVYMPAYFRCTAEASILEPVITAHPGHKQSLPAILFYISRQLRTNEIIEGTDDTLIMRIKNKYVSILMSMSSFLV